MKTDGKFLWYWAPYPEPEVWYGAKATREEAVALALEHNPQGGYSICEADKAQPNAEMFDADNLLEQYEEHNTECWSEDGPEIALTSDDKRSLEKHMAEAFQAWMTASGHEAKAWCFGQTRVHDWIPEHD